MVRDLVNHSVLTGHIDSLQSVTLGVNAIHSVLVCPVLEVQGSENCVSGMLLQNNCGASDVSRFFDPPESDVLLATANKSPVINWTEFKAKNVEIGCLLCKDVRFLTAVDSGNIPDYDHLLVVSIFAHRGEESAIG